MFARPPRAFLKFIRCALIKNAMIIKSLDKPTISSFSVAVSLRLVSLLIYLNIFRWNRYGAYVPGFKLNLENARLENFIGESVHYDQGGFYENF